MSSSPAKFNEKRREFVARTILLGGGLVLASGGRAETYLSVEQAQQLIFPDTELLPQSVQLSSEQKTAIEKAGKNRVRKLRLDAWRSAAGEWFIVDQVIGKHENIDIAVGLSALGAVVGIEILTYRETYGFEVRNERWRAQFHGRDHAELLELDGQIRNISGATLSCRHITDGINRLTQTWQLVLREL